MRFISLIDPADSVSFEQALTRGIASKGGLYFPEHIPKLSEEDIRNLSGTSRQEAARIMLTPWLTDEIPPEDLNDIISQASTFETPVIQVGDRQVLELFHGPTMAFKDIAARYLAMLMSYFNAKTDRQSTVLVATSGDTGGAIAHGFGNIERVRVVVLYPKDRVSKLQKEQLRRVADNVWTLEVEGSFDDCQRLVKQALGDQDLSAELQLTSANSISIGRLLPQMTYYAYAYGQLAHSAVRFVVPSGNLGNLTGGVLAWAMGVPVHSFLAGNNANDALFRYLETGKYKPHSTVQTISNAMDVGAPNNLPRLTKLFNKDLDTMRRTLQAVHVSDEETIQTMRQVYADTGYLLDPHTAVAWRASELSDPSPSDIIVSTASPLKFAEEISEATGIKVDNTEQLQELRKLNERYWKIGSSPEELRQFLKKYLA